MPVMMPGRRVRGARGEHLAGLGVPRAGRAGAGAVRRGGLHQPGGARHLTVDVCGLRFADTASVRALLLAALTLKDQGGFLVLLGPQPALRQVLALLGADQAITTSPAPAGCGRPCSPRPPAGTGGSWST